MKKPIDNRVVSVAVSAGALILLIAFLPLFLRDYYPGLVYEPPTAAPAFTRDEQMRELARLIDEGATHRQGRNPFALPVYRTFREDPALFFESAAQTHQSHMEWAARSIATQINRARSADPAIYAVYRGILDSANQEHPAVVALVNASRLAGLPRPAEVSRIVDPRIEMANFGNPREIGNTGDGIANSLTFLFATDDEFARSQAITDILWHLRRNDCQMVLSSLTYLDEHIRYDIINLLVDRLMAIRQIGSPLYQVYAANLARPSLPYSEATHAVFAELFHRFGILEIEVVPSIDVVAQINGNPVILHGYEIDGGTYIALDCLSRILTATRAQFRIYSEGFGHINTALRRPYNPRGNFQSAMGIVRPSNIPRPRLHQVFLSSSGFSRYALGVFSYYIMNRNYVNPAEVADMLGFEAVWRNDILEINTNEIPLYPWAIRPAVDLLAKFPSIFSFGWYRFGSEFLVTAHWCHETFWPQYRDPVGNEFFVGEVPFLRMFGYNYAIALDFRFYDFNETGNPIIVIYFEDMSRGAIRYAVLFELVGGEFVEVGEIRDGVRYLFRDADSRIVFSTSSEYYALAREGGEWVASPILQAYLVYVEYTFVDALILAHFVNLITGEIIPLERHWDHHGTPRPITRAKTIPGLPDNPLTPLNSMISAEIDITAAVRRVLGLD